MSVPGSTTRSGKPRICPTTPRPRSRKPIEDFRKDFTVSSGELLVIEEEPAEPIDESKIEPEKVKKYVKPDESK